MTSLVRRVGRYWNTWRQLSWDVQQYSATTAVPATGTSGVRSP